MVINAKKGETLEIYDRTQSYTGRKRKMIYSTSEGDMVTEALAARLSLSTHGLNTRIRAYGLLDPRAVHGPNYFKKKKAEWDGLSNKPRSTQKLEKMTMSDFLK